jgi:hypothetical protein
VNSPTLDDRPPDHGVRSRGSWELRSPDSQEVCRHAVRGDDVHRFAAETVHPAGIRDRERLSAPDDRVEDRLDVGRRARDHAQDLAGRRLLLEGLGEVGVLGLQLGEQARVLDGDGRLVGEGLHQRDLSVAERPDLVPVDDDDSQELVRL